MYVKRLFCEYAEKTKQAKKGLGTDVSDVFRGYRNGTLAKLVLHIKKT